MSGLGQHLYGITVSGPCSDQCVLSALLSSVWAACRKLPCVCVWMGFCTSWHDRSASDAAPSVPINTHPSTLHYCLAGTWGDRHTTPVHLSWDRQEQGENLAFWRQFIPWDAAACIKPPQPQHRDRCKWEKIRITEINVWRIQTYAHKYKYIYI